MLFFSPETLAYEQRIALVDGAYTEAERITLEKISKGLGLNAEKTATSPPAGRNKKIGHSALS